MRSLYHWRLHVIIREESRMKHVGGDLPVNKISVHFGRYEVRIMDHGRFVGSGVLLNILRHSPLLYLVLVRAE